MIGKIKKGSGFKGCVNYVLGMEQAEALERARLLNEQAELLRKEADKLGKP